MKHHPLLSIQARYQWFMLTHFKYTSYARYMKKIYNSHLGESCFIIGNGPSLSADDLTVLHNNRIDTFAVNRIFKIFPLTDWRPTYYVSTDPVLIRDTIDDVEKITAEKFIPLQNKYYHHIIVKGAHYFFRNDLRENDQPLGFSINCTNQVNMRGTVTIACMQLAMHMGYKHIYLIGVDHNFDKVITEDGEIVIDNSVKNYFIEGYDDDVSHEVVHNLGVTTKAYMDMKRFVDHTDVEILNASRQTKLDVFDRITFEQAIEEINKRKMEG